MERFFTKVSTITAAATGRPIAFVAAVFLIVLWVITGPLFHWSDTWQLVVNTATTIVTFLMVFMAVLTLPMRLIHRR